MSQLHRRYYCLTEKRAILLQGALSSFLSEDHHVTRTSLWLGWHVQVWVEST